MCVVFFMASNYFTGTFFSNRLSLSESYNLNFSQQFRYEIPDEDPIVDIEHVIQRLQNGRESAFRRVSKSPTPARSARRTHALSSEMSTPSPDPGQPDDYRITVECVDAQLFANSDVVVNTTLCCTPHALGLER
jgi:hypothetical protein